MTSTSKYTLASAATLFTFGFLAMTAPAAYADDYCITGGAQVAHGCGYPSMEVCRAASLGIGGSCMQAPGAQSAENAHAYLPKQARSRSRLRSGAAPKTTPSDD